MNFNPWSSTYFNFSLHLLNVCCCAFQKKFSGGRGGGVIRAFNSLTSFFNCRHLCLFLIHSFWLPLLIGWLVSRHDRHLPPPFYRYLAISTSFRAFFSNFVYICFVLSINHTQFSEIYEVLEESVANWWKYRTPNCQMFLKNVCAPLECIWKVWDPASEIYNSF